MYGKILGVAGRVLAKKFLGKKTKSGKSTFLKRRNVLSGSPLSKFHHKPTKDTPTVLSKYYKKKKD
jgi:hypothetical protein